MIGAIKKMFAPSDTNVRYKLICTLRNLELFEKSDYKFSGGGGGKPGGWKRPKPGPK